MTFYPVLLCFPLSFPGHFLSSLPLLPCPPITALVTMENSSVASASSEAGSTRSQEIEELERFIDSYVLEYQVQGILGDKTDGELDNGSKVPQVSALSGLGVPFAPDWNLTSSCPLSLSPQWTDEFNNKKDGSWTSSRGRGSIRPVSLPQRSGCLYRAECSFHSWAIVPPLGSALFTSIIHILYMSFFLDVLDTLPLTGL